VWRGAERRLEGFLLEAFFLFLSGAVLIESVEAKGPARQLCIRLPLSFPFREGRVYGEAGTDRGAGL
jgi:hypothetical protein